MTASLPFFAPMQRQQRRAARELDSSTMTRASHIYQLCAVTFIYLAAITVTDAYFMADTVWYAQDISRNELWERGHLYWRPLGALLWSGAQPLPGLSSTNPAHDISYLLTMASVATGLLSVYSLYGIIQILCCRRDGRPPAVWIVLATIAAFVFSRGFLNYVQTGASYAPGLSFLLCGIYVSLCSQVIQKWKPAIGLAAGCLLGVSVCLWLPYVFAIPGAVLLPMLLFGRNRGNVVAALSAAASFSVLTAVSYLLVARQMEIDSVTGLTNWILASPPNNISGVARAIYGFARSFIAMGGDGLIYKRFLLGDPHNPVQFHELFRLSLFQLILFYCFLAAILFNSSRSPFGRRILWAWLISAIPVLGFAVHWSGGDVERYLALYPSIFICMALSLGPEKKSKLGLGVTLVFGVCMIATNVLSMSKPALAKRDENSVQRLQVLLPVFKQGSVLVVVSPRDGLFHFNHNVPFHPINRDHGEFVHRVKPTRMKEAFANLALTTWESGGDVWISKQLLEETPEKNLGWVDAEKSIKWSDMYQFFRSLNTKNAVGADDGFVMLAQTEGNSARIRDIANGVSGSGSASQVNESEPYSP
jgi:hypothetical protein